MKIVSFTMVNNESEIIESFIRYNYNFVDKMVIIDNGCTDNTIPIVRKLIQEGLDIVVYDESLEAYNQFRLDNKYLTKIIDEMKPDIILPLDADEFLTGDSNPREILEDLDLNKIYYVNWQWFVMTKLDNHQEDFIPKRLQHCLTKVAWNYSDGSPVTKCIIPAKYYRELQLKLSMGHHTVFGNDKVEIVELSNLRLAHYRAISEEQLIYKTTCYTIRDIATMENNFETAQRTNHMSLIESGKSMWDIAEEISYGGYTRDIIYSPIDLSYCVANSLKIRYVDLSRESVQQRVMQTGREMAIRAYNLERSRKDKTLFKPILLYLDGIRGKECIFPDPSNHLTYLTARYNVRGLVTTTSEIQFLKANFRLIVLPDFAKFLPHEYIVIPDTVNFEQAREELVSKGIEASKILSLAEYKKSLGIIGSIYSSIQFVPNILGRIYAYIQKNGISTTIDKIKARL